MAAAAGKGVRSEEVREMRRRVDEASGGMVKRRMKEESGREDPRLGACGAEHTSEHGLFV